MMQSSTSDVWQSLIGPKSVSVNPYGIAGARDRLSTQNSRTGPITKKLLWAGAGARDRNGLGGGDSLN